MTKIQLAFALVTVALLGAILSFTYPRHTQNVGTVNPGDPSITTFTRLAANDYINNGVEVIGARVASLNAASTTVCAITSPAATSTPLNINALFTVGSSTATTVTIATSTNGTASTTPLMTYALAASTQGTFSFTPTTTDKAIFGPSSIVVVTLTGGAGTFSPTGVCSGMFQLLN